MGKPSEKSLKNLKPVRSTQEARELGRRGGLKSGQTKREKKKLKETINMLLDMPPNSPGQREVLTNLGVQGEDVTNQTLLALSMLERALIGDVKAATWVRDTSGQKPAETLETTVTSHSPLDAELAKLTLEELRALGGLKGK